MFSKRSASAKVWILACTWSGKEPEEAHSAGQKEQWRGGGSVGVFVNRLYVVATAGWIVTGCYVCYLGSRSRVLPATQQAHA
jgi:hypothetical protein